MKKKGIALDAILYSPYEYKKLLKKDQKLNNKYIIYIGDFLESKKACDCIQNWKFDRFGFRYGWYGYVAVITFDRKPSKDEFRQMVNIVETEFVNMKHQIDMLKKLNGNFWNELSTPQKVLFGVGMIAVAALFGVGTGILLHDKENKEIYKCLNKKADKKYMPTEIFNSFTKEIRGPVFICDDDGNDIIDQNYDRVQEESNDWPLLFGYDDIESGTTTWYDPDGGLDSISDIPPYNDDDYDD